MQAQKILLFALVAGLLILQLTPPALARSLSTDGESTELTDTDSITAVMSTDSDPGQSLVSNINFLIDQLIKFIPAIGSACEPPCGATGTLTTGACATCIAATIPEIPMIPSP